MSDLLGGQVDATFMNINTGLPNIKAGKLRALAITSAKRSPLLPDVPTMDELGHQGRHRLLVAGVRRAEGPAGRHQGQAARRHRRRAERPRGQAEAARARLRDRRQHAGAVHRLPGRRVRALEEGDRGRQDHRRLTARRFASSTEHPPWPRRRPSSRSTSRCTSATTSPSSPTTAACRRAPRSPSGLTLVDKVPQGHKVALVDLAAGDAVLRYNVVIGRAARPFPPAAGCTSGCWRCRRRARSKACRSRPSSPPPLPPLEGYTFEGYRNADGSVGTRNILAITTTVQCVAGVVDFAVRRIKDELLPRYPERRRRRRPGAHLRLRRGDRRARCGGPDPHAAQHQLNPNFGNEVMVVSLGCEKLQPERLLPPGTLRDRRRAQRRRRRRHRGGRRSTSCACRTRRTSASCR